MVFPEIEDEKVEEILELFGKKKLKEVKKYAKNMVLWQNEFVALILMARNGLENYKYEMHYWEEQPDHLQLSQEEEKALSENGVGPLKGKAKKAVSKTMQMFVQRKWVVGHLFYTANFKIWHLFYFDLKDVSDQNNHWVGGRHAHYISSLWPQYQLPDIWEKFCTNSKDIGGSVHIQFKNNEENT